MCVFCKIVSGDIPSYKIYEDESYIAILDISQATIGHTLVIPKKHYENIFDLDEIVTKQIFDVVVRVANKLKEKLNIDDLNIINNNGLLAGQTINHFHIHLLPRYQNDQLVIEFSKNNLSKDEFTSLLNQIKN